MSVGLYLKRMWEARWRKNATHVALRERRLGEPGAWSGQWEAKLFIGNQPPVTFNPGCADGMYEVDVRALAHVIHEALRAARESR